MQEWTIPDWSSHADDWMFIAGLVLVGITVGLIAFLSAHGRPFTQIRRAKQKKKQEHSHHTRP